MRHTLPIPLILACLALGPAAPSLRAQPGYSHDPYQSIGPSYPIDPPATYGGGYDTTGWDVGAVPPPPPYRSGHGPSVYHRGYAHPGPSPVIGLAGTLAAQADEFLRAFVHDADRVPQGRRFLADASVLRDAALRLQELAATGADPFVLADTFREVAARWGQLESRMARVSRGRIGPNIATALQMGRTVEALGRILGY